MKSKRIVVIGAAGFIGGALVDKLLSLESAPEIAVIDRQEIDKPGVESFVGDFGDSIFLNEVIRPGDFVYHLACTSVPASSELDVISDVSQNIIKTLHLLEVCGEKKISTFAFASSGGTVYGMGSGSPFKEDDQTEPLGLHGAMKLALEKYVKILSARGNFSYLILRPSNPYGRSLDLQRTQGVIDIFLKKAFEKETIEVWGSGEVVRDYIYIDDLVACLVSLSESSLRNEVLNIGSGQGYTIKQIISEIEVVLGYALPVLYTPGRDFDVPFSVLNIDKAREKLDWHPAYSLHGGLECILHKQKKES